jgi:lactate racemase
MAQQTVRMRFGREGMAVRVPASTALLQGKSIPPLPDPVQAVKDALASPIASEPLIELVQKRRPRSVVITISDITRPVPNQVILPAILGDLNAAGIADDRVTILVATGMHRPSTLAERQEMIGTDLLRRIRVIDHVADDLGTLVQVSDDPPVSVNRLFVEADFRIVTGLIEPHFMAGYSGGRKGVCPGLVDLNTIKRFHGYRTLAHPRATTGVLDGNPCHEESLRVASLVGVDFLVNVSITHERRLAGVYCGDMVEAHLAGVRDVAEWTTAFVDEPFDLILTNGGGYPLDQTFYQTVKGMVGALPAAHGGSTIVVVSACSEGIGSPECIQTMMRWGSDWRGFLRHISDPDNFVKDQWQFQTQTRVLECIGVERLCLGCDALAIDVQRKLGVNPIGGTGAAADRVQQFVDGYLLRHPAARLAVIPEGPYTQLQPAKALVD